MGKREIISEQRKFNYGALFGSWLWGFCNRIKHWTVYTGFVMFILSFTGIPYVGIALIILAIYMGFIGSDLAYNYSDAYYATAKEFARIQKRWAIIFGLLLVGLIIAAFVCSKIYGQQQVMDFLKLIFWKV